MSGDGFEGMLIGFCAMFIGTSHDKRAALLKGKHRLRHVIAVLYFVFAWKNKRHISSLKRFRVWHQAKVLNAIDICFEALS